MYGVFIIGFSTRSSTITSSIKKRKENKVGRKK
jgi:hypothetical protein